MRKVRSFDCRSPLRPAKVRLLAAVPLLLSGASCERTPAIPETLGRPVIIIDVDTLRADALGAYGYARETSPNIDAFAEEAIRFEWAFSQAPTTLPSQISILTSLHPRSHGVLSRDFRLSSSVVTFAERFSEAGYRTAAFVDGGFMNGRFGQDRGFSTYEDTPGGRGFEKIVPAALSWIRENLDAPFLLLVHSYDVHTPYAPPEPFRSMFTSELPAPSPGFEPSVEQMEAVRCAAQDAPLPPHDLAFARGRYDGGVRYADFWVGELLDGLREMGLYDRSVIVLLSDHGEEFQEHGSVLHEKLHAAVTRIPLLLRLPGGRTRGTVPDVVQAIDVMPTLYELAVGEQAGGIQGKSLLPLVQGGEASGAPAFGESPFFGSQRYVTGERHRLIWSAGSDRVELYRYREDPLEQRDLAEEAVETTRELRHVLERHEDLLGRYGSESRPFPVDGRVLEELEALGYVR